VVYKKFYNASPQYLLQQPNKHTSHKSFTMKYSSSIIAVYLLILRSADSFTSTSYRRHTAPASSIHPSPRSPNAVSRKRFFSEVNQQQNIPSSSCTSTTRTALPVATVPVAAITGALTGGLLGGALHAIAGEFAHCVVS
jgi:hypothetical protein